MKIAVAGTGYVGLVTGVCLAEIGNHVICYDVDADKISMLSEGKSPIYEPGIEEMIERNLDNGRLRFTSDSKEAYAEAGCIFIAVGTPEKEDGSANLEYVMNAASAIADHVKDDIIVVVKSTVPVGTNEAVANLMKDNAPHLNISVVSNPEFLREGTAIRDSFKGDRIVIGSDDEQAGDKLESLFKPFHIPVLRTDPRSAEMIKYASNAFLATKISFINEIANLCEETGANIEKVSVGMGMDHRIGTQFLRAGTGFGGSCFPKDTKALCNLAFQHDLPFSILETVIEVNEDQKKRLIYKAMNRFNGLKGKKAAVLGLAFKPNTDDIREAPALTLMNELLLEGVEVTAYDPIAADRAKLVYGSQVTFTDSIDSAIEDTDVAFIMTEWDEMKNYPLKKYKEKMTKPVIFDGRNCYTLSEAEEAGIEYHSIGRRAVMANHEEVKNKANRTAR